MSTKSNIVFPPAVNYYSIPGSTAVIERRVTVGSGKPCALVRCGDCFRRLFDVFESEVYLGVDPHYDVPMHADRYFIVRRCRKCKTRNTKLVTTEPGIPVGESGPWDCTHCEWHLALIEVPHGRPILQCPRTRCKQEARVTAADVFTVLKRLEQAKPAEPEPDDDFDDLPF